MQRLGVISVVVSLVLSAGPLLLGIEVPPAFLLLSYPFLLGGFPLWTMGNNQLRRLRNTPRADRLLNEQLKGLGNKYSLHHYVPLEGGMVKHLLVAPAGLVVVESRDTLGAVSCKSGPKGDKWSERSGFMGRLGGMRTPIGNPSQDLDSATRRAKQLLASTGKPDVQAKGLIVFTRQEDLEIENCSYPAVPISEVKDAVRQIIGDLESARGGTSKVHEMLTSEDRRKVNAKLAIDLPATLPKPASARR